MKHAIGIDLGGTNIKYIIIDNKGNEIDHFQNSTEVNKGSKNILHNILNGIKHLTHKHKNIKIEGIGIGSPGLINEKGTVIYGADNLPGWIGTDIKSYLSKQIKLPIFVDNDVTLVALGEAYFGAGKNEDTVLCLALGTGLGGGIVINKKIHRGKHGYAGEFGHLIVNPNGFNCTCGKKGCLETYASAIGLKNLVKKHIAANTKTKILEYVSQIEEINPIHIFKGYKENDNVAIKILDEMSYYLGMGISHLYHIFDPDIIILAGGISKEGETLVDLTKKHLKEFLLSFYHDKLNIKPSKFQHKCGSIGAASLVFEEMNIATL